MNRATRDGYTITHFTIPFYFIQPSSLALLGFAQTLVLAVEHTLTSRLYIMVGHWKACEGLALWERSAQEYDGLNSHSCMFEMRSLELVDPGGIAQLLQERKEGNNRQKKIYRETHEEIKAKKTLRQIQRVEMRH